VEYLCKLCLIPGIWHCVILRVDNKTTLATFREAELGFFGELINTFKHVAFFCGQKSNFNFLIVLFFFFLKHFLKN